MFTPNGDWKGKTQLTLGLASIILGTTAWTYAARSLGGLGLGNVIPWNPTFAGFLLPISIPVLMGGIGLCTYCFAMRRTWRASNRIESALFELEALVSQKNGLGEPPQNSVPSSGAVSAKKDRFSFGSTALAFALAEAIILLVIYGGLVREYASNPNMQNWVRANFLVGSYLLSYNAVLGLAGILGVMFFQLIPRKMRPKRINS